MGAVSGSCSLQAFCTAATKHEPKQGSMEKGVADTYKIIAEVVNSVPQGEMVLSRMNQLKTSFELGFKTEDEQICTDIYVCNNPEEGKQGRNGLKCHQTNAASWGCYRVHSVWYSPAWSLWLHLYSSWFLLFPQWRTLLN